MYAPASALFLHLGLERPLVGSKSPARDEKVLIWGASSSMGALATQIAVDAGYTVVAVASAHNRELVASMGAEHFLDRKTENATTSLVALGPYKAVFAAAESAADQLTIGEVLAKQGGGRFLTTMGVRPGVNLPSGVEGFFVQYLDDYMDPNNAEYTEWFWWGYLENALTGGKLKPFPTEVKGGLSSVMSAWNALREGKMSGRRQIIHPGED